MSGWSLCCAHIWFSPHSFSLLIRQTLFTFPTLLAAAASSGEHLGTEGRKREREVRQGIGHCCGDSLCLVLPGILVWSKTGLENTQVFFTHPLRVSPTTRLFPSGFFSTNTSSCPCNSSEPVLIEGSGIMDKFRTAPKGEGGGKKERRSQTLSGGGNS